MAVSSFKKSAAPSVAKNTTASEWVERVRDADLRTVDQSVTDPHQLGGQRRHGDIVEDGSQEQQDEQHGHAAEHGGKLRNRAALVIDRRTGEGRGTGRHTEQSRRDIARAHAHEFLIRIQTLAASGGQRFGDGGGFQHPDDGDGNGTAGQLANDRQLILQGGKMFEGGQRGGQRTFVLDQMKRDFGMKISENPRGNRQEMPAPATLPARPAAGA